MKSQILLLCLLLVAFAFAPRKPVRIFMAGDSTMQTYNEEKTPMRGWGQVLPRFFNEQVVIENRAIGGRSTKTFISEDRWQKLVDQLQKGDFVFIQFGHNDASNRPERYTSPDDYRANLVRMVQDARAKGAKPVLFTPIAMRRFKDGQFTDGHGHYPGKVREVARELKVPLVDMTEKTNRRLTELGEEATARLFMNLAPGEHPAYHDGLKDNTHLQEEGALLVAALAVEGIRELKLKPLVAQLRKEPQAAVR
jgi:lysophospholipase L1-like esterase